MEVIKLIEAIKDENKDIFKELVEKEGRKSIASLSEIIGKRAYFTIDESGAIGRKGMNYALPLVAFTGNMEILGEQLYELSNPKERVKHKKIERLATEDIEKIYKNFFKVVANSNVDFAKRYSKEMYLRDRDRFFKKLFNYTLLEDIDSQKTLMALAMKELLWDEYDDNIMNAGISYIASVRSDFSAYEKADETLDKEDVVKGIEELKVKESKEDLNLISYLKVLGEYTYINEGVFAGIAHKRMTDSKEKTDLNSYEKEIIKGL